MMSHRNRVSDEDHNRVPASQRKLLVTIFSLLTLLLAAASLTRPALAQAGGGITGTWIFDGPLNPDGSRFRSFNIFRSNGTYQTDTITLNGPPSLGRVDGRYSLEPRGAGKYGLHIENTGWAPKQICIRGGACRALHPPAPTLDDEVTVNGDIMRFASGMVVRRGAMPPQFAVPVAAVRMVTPSGGGGRQAAPVNRGSGGSASGGSGSQQTQCRNNVEQQRCISLGGNSYMYTDSHGCRVCQYVP